MMEYYDHTKIKFTEIIAPASENGEEWTWCYSAKQLEKEFTERFAGKSLKAAYIKLEGYYDSGHHSTDCIDLSCESGACKLIIGDMLLELGLHVEGQFEYRISSVSAAEMRETEGYPPDDYGERCNCYLNVNDHDTTVKISGQEIKRIEVKGTNIWAFSVHNFDEVKADAAAAVNDLPAEIVIVTDAYTLRLIGDDIEYYILILERH